MNGISGTRFFHRLGGASALAAAFSLAVPAGAAELPRSRTTAQADDENANTAWDHRRWRGRHHDRIDGGDVLAGVLILGGIAALAGAAKNNRREEQYRYPPPPPPNDRYDYRGQREGATSGLGRAADICTDAIERTIDPVGSIDAVRRGPSGWDVDGTLQDGSPFACTIGNDGEISDIRVDRSYRGAASDTDGGEWNAGPSSDDSSYQGSYEDNQWDDDTYARVREQREAGEGYDGQGG